MAGWLKSASSRLLSNSPKKSTSYSRLCSCGELIQGRRSEQVQTEVCAVCGTPHLVLPISPYPTPRPPKGYQSRTASSPKPDRKPKRPPSKLETVDEIPTAENTQTSVPEEEVSQLQLANKIPIRQRVRKQFTPLKISVMVAFSLLALTAYGIWWQQQVNWASENYTTATELAFQALETNAEVEAIEQFSIASRSATILGLTDEKALDVQQYDKEFSTQGKLCTASLTEIFQSLEKKFDDQPESASSLFNALYAGDWLILDVTGKLSLKEGQVLLEMEAPITHPEASLLLRIVIPSEHGTPVTDERGEVRFILGTRMESLTAREDLPLHWELICDQTFLWGHANTLKMIGIYDENPELQAQLDRTLQLQTNSQFVPSTKNDNVVAEEGSE